MSKIHIVHNGELVREISLPDDVTVEDIVKVARKHMSPGSSFEVRSDGQVMYTQFVEDEGPDDA